MLDYRLSGLLLRCRIEQVHSPLCRGASACCLLAVGGLRAGNLPWTSASEGRLLRKRLWVRLWRCRAVMFAVMERLIELMPEGELKGEKDEDEEGEEAEEQSSEAERLRLRTMLELAGY